MMGKIGFAIFFAPVRTTLTSEAKATWHELVVAADDAPNDVPYQFKPVFTRSYPKSGLTVESILETESKLQPRK